MDDANSTAAVALLPSVQVNGPTKVTLGSPDRARSASADHRDPNDGFESLSTSPATAVAHNGTGRGVASRGRTPPLSFACESDSYEEPLFQQPSAAVVAATPPQAHASEMRPYVRPEQRQLLGGRPWSSVNASAPWPAARADSAGRNAVFTLPPASALGAMQPDTLNTPLDQCIGADGGGGSHHAFLNYAKSHSLGPATATTATNAGGVPGSSGCRGDFPDIPIAATAVMELGGDNAWRYRPLFMTTGPSENATLVVPSATCGAPPGRWMRGASGEGSGSGNVALAHPASPVELRDAVPMAEPPTPAKQRRTIHAGPGCKSVVSNGGAAPPRLSSSFAVTTTASASPQASPKPSTFAPVPPRAALHNPNGASVSVPCPTTPSTGVVFPPSFKFHRREGSRKRSADVLSQFSALDLDETPASPYNFVGTSRLANTTQNGVTSAPSLQWSPPKLGFRNFSGGGSAMGPGSPLVALDYATPITLSQRLGAGSNTYSQMLLHPSQDILDMSQADTECSNFLARRILNEYNEVRLLGSGSYGTVSLYQEVSSGELVAVKVSPPLRAPEMERRYRRERSVMGMVRGLPHIVQLSAAWEEGRVPRMYLQLEYCPGGSVAAVANERRRRNEVWAETEVKVLLAHMSIALDALHRVNIAHVDFKPDNILLDKEGAYKLSDFGCSVLLDERGRPRRETRNGYGSPVRSQRQTAGGGYHNAYVGANPGGAADEINSAMDFQWNDGNELSTVSVDEGDCRYLCADMLNEKLHFKAGDMFSLGMSLYELMSGQPLPRNGEQFLSLRRHVPTEMLRRRGYSAELVELVVELLHSDPLKRPTARQILQRLRPSREELQLLSSSSDMERWTESAEGFQRLQDEAEEERLRPTGAKSDSLAVSLSALRCVSALTEASAWLLTTTRQDVHHLGGATPSKGAAVEADEQHPYRRQLLLQPTAGQNLHHTGPLEELPMSPITRGEACTPTTLKH